jgi:endonuclease YncB( thermonuclease family)
VLSQGQQDVFDRLLAYVWLADERNFGETMIANASPTGTRMMPDTYLDSFRAAHDTAIANRGLWSPAPCAGDTEQPAQRPSAPALRSGPRRISSQAASGRPARR